MRLSDILVIKDILSRHGFSFSKGLGQNFLINPSVCPKMAEMCGADCNSGVLEIGPGFGVLTYELAQVAKKLVAVEIDARLPAVLAETLSEFDNVTVINEDILKVDINKLIAENFSDCERVYVCANLPYYITSPVIMTLLEQKLPITSITVMVQKEVAQRMCARVGSRMGGAVTVAVNYYSEPEILFSVSKGSFMPAPKVDSAVLKLNLRSEPCVKVKDEKFFFTMVKAAFGQRRKTLLNSLSSGLSAEKSKIAEAIEKVGLSPTARAEELSMEQLGRLADELFEIHN